MSNECKVEAQNAVAEAYNTAKKDREVVMVVVSGIGARDEIAEALGPSLLADMNGSHRRGVDFLMTMKALFINDLVALASPAMPVMQTLAALNVGEEPLLVRVCDTGVFLHVMNGPQHMADPVAHFEWPTNVRNPGRQPSRN